MDDIIEWMLREAAEREVRIAEHKRQLDELQQMAAKREERQRQLESEVAELKRQIAAMRQD